MSVFLFTTLLTFSLLFLVAISQPAWLADEGAEAFPGEPRGRRGLYALVPPGEAEASPPAGRFPRLPRIQRNWAILIVQLLLLGSGWGLIHVTFRSLHRPYPFGWPVDLIDAFTGRNAASLVFGAITGTLACLFLTRIFFRPPDAKLEARDKIVLALLIVFLVLGIVGEEAIRGLAQRVSKVSALGAEVSFSGPADKTQSRTSREGSPSNVVGNPGSTSAGAPLVLPGSSGGLSILSSLDAIIERDRDYMKLISSFVHPNSMQFIEEENNLIQGETEKAINFAKLLIRPFASCLNELHKQTGDTEFINDRLSGLVQALRYLIVPLQHNDTLAAIVTDVFFDQSDRLAEFVFLTAVNDDELQSSDVIKACTALFYLLVDESPWKVKKDKITSGEISKEGEVSKEKDWVLRNKSKINEFYKHKDGDYRKPANGSSHRRDSGEVGDFGKLKEEISKFLSKGTYKERPYVSVIYASIMAQLGRPEAALIELDRWLERDRGRQPSSVRPYRSWYSLRTINTAYLLTEEWLRRPSTSVPSALRAYHIANLTKAANLLDELLRLRKFRDDYTTLAASLEESEFRRPKDDGSCKPKNGEGPRQFELVRRAYTVMVQAKLFIAHNALLHPEYNYSYVHGVSQIIAELLKTDFSCLTPTDGAAGIDQMRAELLRLYAEMKVRAATVIAEIRGSGAADDELRKGFDAVSLGLEIIYPHQQRDRKKLDTDGTSDSLEATTTNGTPNLFERISESANIETFDSLIVLREKIPVLREQLSSMRRDSAK